MYQLSLAFRDRSYEIVLFLQFSTPVGGFITLLQQQYLFPERWKSQPKPDSSTFLDDEEDPDDAHHNDHYSFNPMYSYQNSHHYPCRHRGNRLLREKWRNTLDSSNIL